MTNQEFAELQENLFDEYDIPQEFRGAISYKAWEDGHAYGYSEVISHLRDLIYMLEKPLKDFTKRIKSS